MEPNRIGRILGIGARVAGGKLREQVDRLGAPAKPGEPSAATTEAPGRAQEAGARIGAGVAQAARNFRAATANTESAGTGAGAKGTTRNVARGAAHFGAALVRPFAHATNLLWQQITGIFFALFALFFLEHAWMVYRAAHWRDRHVFLYGVLAAVFGWFAASTFWRVRRKQRG